MSFSSEPIIPIEPTPPPEQNVKTAMIRGRRRRVLRRDSIPADSEGQAALISSLSRRAYPSFELFVFSLVCGAIVGLGFLLDSQAVLLLGILVTPLMTPWVGFLLAILTGSPRLLFETFMALFISAVIVFIGGLLTGFAARLFLPITLTNVFIHARLWIPELIVLAVGAVTLVASFARSEDKPFLPSVIIAYSFYLPINAGGFGLGSGVIGIWPQGILVFLVHFMLASILGLITLLALKLRPSMQGMIYTGVALLLFAGILFRLMGTGIPSANAASAASSTSTPVTQPSPLPSPTPNLPATPTSSPRPATPTRASSKVDVSETVAVAFTQAAKTPSAVSVTPTLTTPTITVSPTQTSTITLTVAPKIIPGTVSASEGGGANLRQTPNGKYLMTLDNGVIVDIYPDFRRVNGITWVHVFVTRDGIRVEGWLLESVVTYATPEANFEPSDTPTP